MYEASAAFHTAVANGEPQKVLLIFSDAVFTAEDIDIDSGFEMDDNFCMSGDISIGQATSNELRFSLYNDARLLNDYEFGEFTATVGARIGTATYTVQGNATVVTGNATYVGRVASPFLRRNGVNILTTGAFPVTTLLAYGGKVYAMSNDGRYAVFDDATGANITASNPVNAFMLSKAVTQWYEKGMRYDPDDRMLWIYDSDGVVETYEFVPWGVFEAERPNAPDQIRIDMTCHDRMTKFECDMPSFATLGFTNGMPTLGQLLTKMCEYKEVPLVTSTFINSTARPEEEPDFSSSTMRNVIQWIAEAAAANARFDRDGGLVLDWIHSETNWSYSESDYKEYQPYWYTTQKITKLYNRTTQDGEDRTVDWTQNNETTVGYLIQDNPFLDGVT